MTTNTPGNRRLALYLTLVTIAGACLRFLHIARRSFWADEAFSITLAELPWQNFRYIVVHNEANMALYYVLLRFWSRISDGPEFVRALSALAGVVTIAIIYFAGRDFFSRRAGLIAALLLAVNVFHIQYSREARSYSLVVMLITGSSLMFMRNVKSPGRFGSIAYVIVTAAALYAHFFAALVCVAQLVSWIFLPAQVRRWAQLRDLFAVALLGSPLVLFVANYRTSPLSWVTHPGARDVYHLFTAFSGSGVCFIVFVLAIAVAARQFLAERERERSSLSAWAFIFAMAWLLLPVAVTLIASHWKPMFSPRFLLICLPAAILLFAQGLSLLRPAALGFAATAIVLVASLVALHKYDRQPDPSNWKGAVAYLAQNAARGDVLVFGEGYCRMPFDYNSRAFGIELPQMEILPGPQSTPALRNAQHVWVICGQLNSSSIPGFQPVSIPQFRGVDMQELKPPEPTRQ